jgi:hypothetical protein
VFPAAFQKGRVIYCSEVRRNILLGHPWKYHAVLRLVIFTYYFDTSASNDNIRTCTSLNNNHFAFVGVGVVIVKHPLVCNCCAEWNQTWVECSLAWGHESLLIWLTYTIFCLRPSWQQQFVNRFWLNESFSVSYQADNNNLLLLSAVYKTENG